MLPTYWISTFKLPQWVIKEIDRIRRDFLWFGPDLEHHSCRLVNWDQLCKSRNQGGWGILNLEDHNSTLLMKWWWKIAMGANWCGLKVVLFNYFQNIKPWNLFNKPPHRRSFFGMVCSIPCLTFFYCVPRPLPLMFLLLILQRKFLDGSLIRSTPRGGC